jgi:methylmalonyl-CoA decarboxylase
MQLVTSRTENDVGTIIMDNAAKRNALSEQMTGEIRAALDGFRVARVRSAVLRAPAGSKVWSAGHDIQELPNARRDPLGWGDSLRVLVRAIQEFPAPVIGLIEGGVWGGACEVAMACDIIVSTPDATFAITPAKLGIPYNLTGLLTLMNAIPLPVAKEMLFTARPLSAERAYELGAINHLREKHEIEAFVYELAAAIGRNAPLSISAMKEEMRLLASAHAMSPAMFERIQGLRRVVYDSLDYQEGLDAWRAKRQPHFGGH